MLSSIPVALVVSFVTVFIAEFGDKSQIAIITLSTKQRPIKLYIGSFLAFLAVDGIIALVFSSVFTFLPVFWISLASGIFFIIFGIYTILSKEKKHAISGRQTGSIKTSFLLIAALENGDKTQLAVIALSARFAAPLQVFLGVMLAFAILIGISIALGRIVQRYVDSRYIKIGSGIIFVLFGIIFLFSIFSGVKIL